MIIRMRAWLNALHAIEHERNTMIPVPASEATRIVEASQSGAAVLMSWVGQDDKDQVDIYEDDIITVQLPMGGFWGNTRKEKIGVVEYGGDQCGFIVRWNYGKNQHHIRLDCDICFDAKVLGNKHQHPHLMDMLSD